MSFDGPSTDPADAARLALVNQLLPTADKPFSLATMMRLCPENQMHTDEYACIMFLFVVKLFSEGPEALNGFVEALEQLSPPRTGTAEWKRWCLVDSSGAKVRYLNRMVATCMYTLTTYARFPANKVASMYTTALRLLLVEASVSKIASDPALVAVIAPKNRPPLGCIRVRVGEYPVFSSAEFRRVPRCMARRECSGFYPALHRAYASLHGGDAPRTTDYVRLSG